MSDVKSRKEFNKAKKAFDLGNRLTAPQLECLHKYYKNALYALREQYIPEHHLFVNDIRNTFYRIEAIVQARRG